MVRYEGHCARDSDGTRDQDETVSVENRQGVERS